MKSPLSDFVSFQIQRGDFIFLLVLFIAVFAFVAVESVWLVRQIKNPQHKQSLLIWSLIPALVFLILTRAYKSPSPEPIEFKKEVTRHESP